MLNIKQLIALNSELSSLREKLQNVHRISRIRHAAFLGSQFQKRNITHFRTSKIGGFSYSNYNSKVFYFLIQFVIIRFEQCIYASSDIFIWRQLFMVCLNFISIRG